MSIRIPRLGSLFTSPAGRLAAAVSVITLGLEVIKAIIDEQSETFEHNQQRLSALGLEIHRATELHKAMGARLQERTAELAAIDAEIDQRGRYTENVVACEARAE